MTRNRVRRRLRAVVSGLAGDLAPGAYLLVAAPEAATLDPSQMTSTVSTALARLADRR